MREKIRAKHNKKVAEIRKRVQKRLDDERKTSYVVLLMVRAREDGLTIHTASNRTLGSWTIFWPVVPVEPVDPIDPIEPVDLT